MKQRASHPTTEPSAPSGCPFHWLKKGAPVAPFRSRLIILWMLLMVGGGAFMVWRLYREQIALYHSMAIQGTSIQVETLKEFRRLYSTEVVARVRALGIEVVHDYENKERALPLPATFTIKLGEAINRERPGAF